jgi:hypothetical protein
MAGYPDMSRAGTVVRAFLSWSVVKVSSCLRSANMSQMLKAPREDCTLWCLVSLVFDFCFLHHLNSWERSVHHRHIVFIGTHNPWAEWLFRTWMGRVCRGTQCYPGWCKMHYQHSRHSNCLMRDVLWTCLDSAICTRWTSFKALLLEKPSAKEAQSPILFPPLFLDWRGIGISFNPIYIWYEIVAT